MPANQPSESDSWEQCSEEEEARRPERTASSSARASAARPSAPHNSSSHSSSSSSSTTSEGVAANLMMQHIEETAMPGPPAVGGATLSLGPPLDLLAAAGSPLLNTGLPKSRFHLGVAVVGEPGSGKSTLVHNLFHPFNKSTQQEGDTSACALAGHSPSLRASLSSYAASTPVAEFTYTVLEVFGGPAGGYGATALCDTITSLDAAYEAQWAAARRPGGVADGRIDVCLFLLPPHSMGEEAVAAVKKLSERVPVLPVLGKADAMTPAELAALRNEVIEALGMKSPLVFPANPSLLAQAGAQLGAAVLPLAVVGSTENMAGVDSFWPARQYPWGCVEVFNCPHSDMLILRKLLLEAGFFALKEATDKRATSAPASTAADATSAPACSAAAEGASSAVDTAEQRANSAATSAASKRTRPPSGTPAAASLDLSASPSIAIPVSAAAPVAQRAASKEGKETDPILESISTHMAMLERSRASAPSPSKPRDHK